MKGIAFSRRSVSDLFIPGKKRNNRGNGFEYEFVIQLIAEVKNAIEEGNAVYPCLYGEIDSFFLSERFFSSSPPELMREQKTDGFPDCVLMQKNLIVILDHFQIDASKPILKRGKCHGTEYQKFIGEKTVKNSSLDLALLEKELAESSISFSLKWLKINFERLFEEKAKKVDQYIKRVKEHIKQSPNKSIHDADLKKPLENWFLIEDVSPTSYAAALGDTIAKLLQKNQQVSGLVIYHNGIPRKIYFTAAEVMIIKNDEKARRELQDLSKC